MMHIATASAMSSPIKAFLHVRCLLVSEIGFLERFLADKTKAKCGGSSPFASLRVKMTRFVGEARMTIHRWDDSPRSTISNRPSRKSG